MNWCQFFPSPNSFFIILRTLYKNIHNFVKKRQVCATSPCIMLLSSCPVHHALMLFLQAVTEYRQKICKCHGLSGSCELQTCTLKMPSFREVGNRLKERFDSAYKVTFNNDGEGIIPHEEDDSIKDPQVEDLVYLEKSPNFCKPSRKRGSPGTRDRVCDPKSKSTNGCDIMCCGRGYRSFQMVVKENCKCQFQWCCEVVCQTCVRTHTVHRCY